ncbi:MAG: tetratricopeptide repeat protein [Alphaproteobacteria bacterium]|nr:tetratricopeptide repeat protein [Alphaproteobacteria bacterium]
MPLALVSLAFQGLFAIHAWRTGRDRFWIYILLIFPVVGCLVYFFAEILPDMIRGKEMQDLRRWWELKKDPDKEMNAAHAALAMTPTVTNRLKLAQVLMKRQDFSGVVTTLTPALDGHFADDPAVLEGLAYAYYYKKDYPQALNFAEKICNHENWLPKDYIKLLRAQIFQVMGQNDAAKAAYAELIKIYSGEEARIEYARLLNQLGDHVAAQELYADIVRRAPHTPQHYQVAQKRWIDEARGALKQ